MVLRNFGKFLKEARVEKGLSQRSLGLSLGLSDKTISSYESSRSFPTLDMLQKIAEVLEKDVTFFVCDEKHENNIQGRLNEIVLLQNELNRKIARLSKLISKEE